MNELMNESKKKNRTLCMEICKTISNLHPGFMKVLFKVRKTNKALRIRCKLNLEILKLNQVSLGSKCLFTQSPRV